MMTLDIEHRWSKYRLGDNDDFRFIGYYGDYDTDESTIRFIHFMAGMVLWYNAKRGEEVLRFRATTVVENPSNDMSLWLSNKVNDLSDFWDEYDRERVRKEIWYSFEEPKDRSLKRFWLALGYRPVCWAVPKQFGGI